MPRVAESYLRASALFVAPGWWVSANDVQLAEQHRRLAAAPGPLAVLPETGAFV